MGQAPPSGSASLRVFSRSFPGRSGTPDDQVYLCSPAIAAASMLTGVISDPRELADAALPERPEARPEVLETEIAGFGTITLTHDLLARARDRRRGWSDPATSGSSSRRPFMVGVASDAQAARAKPARPLMVGVASDALRAR
jgi:hypothetical protein